MQPRPVFIVGLVFVLIALVVAVDADDRLKCHETGRLPRTPYALDVCYMYSHKACCLSGYDKFIKEAYSTIIPGGSGCLPGSPRIRAMLYELLKYLCLPCNPDEPRYRFESVMGDIADGGVVPPSENSEPGDHTWRICKSFLYGRENSREGIWGRDASQYDTCGITLQTCLATPIFDISTARFTFPSDTCTTVNDLVIPSIAFANSTNPGLEMLSLVAQTTSDFQIVIVDDWDPTYNFDATPCFGRSS